MATRIEAMQFQPSGKRSATTITARASGGVQSTRRAMHQMIPDGLSPDEHAAVATTMVHPMMLPASVHPPVRKALGCALQVGGQQVARAFRVADLIEALGAQLQEENDPK